MSKVSDGFPLLRTLDVPADLRAHPENKLGEVCAELKQMAAIGRITARANINFIQRASMDKISAEMQLDKP